MKKIFFLSIFLFANYLFAADQDDIYLEAKGGTNLEVTTELLTGAQFGYVFVDSLGLGLSIEQVFSTTSQSTGKQGFQLGPEVRWFLEPLEFTGSFGFFTNSTREVLYLSATGTYLFALAPALALAADLRLRYLFDEGTAFYFLAGVRVLF